MLEKTVSTLKGIRVGLALTALAVALAIGITSIFGPVFGTWDWAELSLGFLFLAVIGIGALVEFTRSMNPYNHAHPLYDLKDVAKDEELESGGYGWLWNVLPAIATGAVIFIAFA